MTPPAFSISFSFPYLFLPSSLVTHSHRERER
jgi:hypothetical protein